MRPSADRVREAAAVRPSPRQIAWQEREFYGFLHVGMNTMTDREWGTGAEDPAWFDPRELYAGQWMAALRAAGMRGVVLTAKHHDGFCLWPSRFSRHTVAASPWRGGRGDLVREVADAAAEHGLAFGVYLSPWDRSAPTYGQGRAYDDVFVGQLTELLSGYGSVAEVWFDGACGEGPNGRRQVYDWERYYAVVRRLQPDAVIAVCGPDVRWCGNEAGHTRADEWSVVPGSLRDAVRVQERSQQSEGSGFARLVRSDDEDLGSRSALAQTEEPLVWYPAEVNTSIRPGWYHHPAEDDQVRSADELFAIYRRSVGGNATLLLNVPPDRRGLVAEPDMAVLRELGQRIRGLRGRDVARQATLAWSSGSVDPAVLLDLSLRSGAWRPDPRDAQPSVTLRWPAPVTVDGVVLRELVTEGQVVEEVAVTGVTPGGERRVLGRFGTVGYQRIVDLDPVTVTSLSVTVTRSRGPVALCGLAVLGAQPAIPLSKGFAEAESSRSW